MYPNLRAELTRRGLTMSEFAKRIGMSPQCLSYRMNGKRNFTYPEALRIKKELGVDIPLEILFCEAN